MKASKLLSSLLVAVSLLALVPAEAGSIGRSSSSSSAGRSSSSFSRPSAPSPAPSVAPSKPGGIGGTQASVGVRKSEVTAPVQNQVAQSKPAPTAPSVGNVGTTPHPSSPSPTYGTVHTPVYASPAPQSSGMGSAFVGSLGGSMLGTMLGNSISGNHGGTTVINNGREGSGYASAGNVIVPSAQAQGINDSQFNPGAQAPSNKKEYTVWSFIADLIGFVFVVAILLGVAWLFYKGYQLVRNYVNKERGVNTHPFNATQRFWEIQKAFATADLTTLQKLLGPDVVDELTNDLQPQGLTIKNVSHEIRLENSHEFSIWYKFFETDGEEINQVWHYERFGSEWKLNGIENV